MPSANPGCRILAVATLYEQEPTESRALSSFFRLVEGNLEIASRLSLVVYDNSPQAHRVDNDFTHHYFHDPANGGLAAAYNYALVHAEANGYQWLLLLDQDTTLTSEFFAELISCIDTLLATDHVAAIVPKLMVRGAILSPAEHFVEFLRHQFRNAVKTLAVEDAGIQRSRISAYNSGSTLRVSALRAIGGFPGEFWLDYLDHAVFHALTARGYQVYVLHCVLEHQLAESNLDGRPLWRFRNVLRAQSLFVKRAGSLGDRLLYRLWLLRSVRRLRADCHDGRIWKETMLQALFFNAPDSSTPPATKYTQEGS